MKHQSMKHVQFKRRKLNLMLNEYKEQYRNSQPLTRSKSTIKSYDFTDLSNYN